MQDVNARAEAERWGGEILAGGPWAADRFRMELHEERWRHHPTLQRDRYQARFRLWEACGWAKVELDQEGQPTRVILPHAAGGEGEPSGPALSVGQLERAAAAALRVARERGEARPLRVRLIRPEPPGRLAARAAGLLLERHPVDGQLVVDLDPAGAGRVGYLCAPLFRQANRSAALQRSSALTRAKAALRLPKGARLASARLVRGELGRAWRLRWVVDTPERVGAVLATLNARTGRLAVYLTTVAPRPRLLPATAARDAAERELRQAVQHRLGPGARVGSLVLGVSEDGPEVREAWLAAVLGPDGTLFRALLDRGKVTLKRTA